MQVAALALVVAAVTVTLPSMEAQASGTVVAFAPPAQVGPDVAVEGSQWLLLVFSNATPASGSLAFDGMQAGEEFLEVDVQPVYPGVARDPVYAPLTSRQSEVPRFDAALSFGQGPASLYVEASSISWSLGNNWTSLEWWQNPACLQAFVDVETRHERSGRFDGMCPTQSVALSTSGTSEGLKSVSVKASGIATIEFHNADLNCREASCPSGGSRDEQRHEFGGATATRRVLSFNRLTGPGDGQLELSGLASVVMGGGLAIDLAVEGIARLPEASLGSPGSGETLQIAGNFSLQGLTGGNGGSLTGKLEGQITGARLDETAIDPASLLEVGAIAAGVVATVGLAVAIKTALGTLFTKMRPERALLNENRRAVHDYVQQFPGATLREIMRGTTLAGGTVRNHLRRLKESGHVVEQPHGASRRFFPSSQRKEAKWSRTILLREQTLRQLWQLVQQNPWLAQGDYLDLASREFGWSRSTTQHRLGRLVKGGLVTTRQEGRFKLHCVVEG